MSTQITGSAITVGSITSNSIDLTTPLAVVDGGTGVSTEQTLGVGQTWISNGAGITRAVATTYTNDTGRPIMVLINLGLGDNATSTLTLNGTSIAISNSSGTTGSSVYPFSFIVPSGNTYAVSAGTLTNWMELR